VVVVGGVGSLLGTVLSAGMLGQINGIISVMYNDIIARAIVFAVVIGIILWRPNGLFSFRSR
jgi:urea transport system permease protein